MGVDSDMVVNACPSASAGKPERGPAWKSFDLLPDMQTNHPVLGGGYWSTSKLWQTVAL